MELLTDHDVLRKVVEQNGSDGRDWLHVLHLGEGRVQRVERATRRLAEQLPVQPVKKTNLIAISYRAADAESAAKLLRYLAAAYMEKHTAVHRPAGEDGRGQSSPFLSLPVQALHGDRSLRPAEAWNAGEQRRPQFLGRFSPEKGCHLLVQAFERIETDIKLVMAGGASYSDEYQRELLKHADDRIRIMGWVAGEDLDELLSHAMIFVLPSDMEGLSLALLDAMGAGLCVLASDVPENREAVEGAGFTFRCGELDDLSDRLRFLIANPAIRDAAGKAARKRVEEEYQWGKISRDIEQAYFEVLGLNSHNSKRPSAQEVRAAEAESERVAG